MRGGGKSGSARRSTARRPGRTPQAASAPRRPLPRISTSPTAPRRTRRTPRETPHSSASAASRARRPRATSAPRRRASQATRRESPAPAGTPPRNTPRRAAPRGRSAAAGGIARISAPRRGTADSPRRGSEKTDCLCRLLPYGNYMPRAAHNLSFGNCQNGEAVVKSFGIYIGERKFS